MEYHTLGGLSKRDFFSYSSGGWKSTIKVPADLIPGEGSLPSLLIAAFSLCPEMGFPWRYHHRNNKLSGASSYKDTHPIKSGPHPYDLMNLSLISSVKAASPNTATLELGFQHGKGVGDTYLVPNKLHVMPESRSKSGLCPPASVREHK